MVVGGIGLGEEGAAGLDRSDIGDWDAVLLVFVVAFGMTVVMVVVPC